MAKILVVTSGKGGVGKTTTSAAIGTGLALRGHKTVIVDFEPERRPTKVINHPIRGGQQIYAADGDLVVLGPVSAGAELLADGNIHVYGPMRGRALAGVKGDTGAQIFCQQMGAEMLSIAGIYKVAEDLRRDPQWGRSVHVSLSGDVLNITRL